MIYRTKHFELQELVCPHVFYKFKEQAWDFLDWQQMINLDWVRDQLGATFVNNWYDQYLNSDFVRYIRDAVESNEPIFPFREPKPPEALLYQRGLRCNICGISYAKTQAGQVYVSGHFLGKADDYNVDHRPAEEVRQYLIKHQDKITYPMRLEKGTSWVHMDSEETGEKVHLF
jgi:hypothetical protein